VPSSGSYASNAALSALSTLRNSPRLSTIGRSPRLPVSKVNSRPTTCIVTVPWPVSMRFWVWANDCNVSARLPSCAVVISVPGRANNSAGSSTPFPPAGRCNVCRSNSYGSFSTPASASVPRCVFCRPARTTVRGGAGATPSWRTSQSRWPTSSRSAGPVIAKLRNLPDRVLRSPLVRWRDPPCSSWRLTWASPCSSLPWCSRWSVDLPIFSAARTSAPVPIHLPLCGSRGSVGLKFRDASTGLQVTHSPSTSS
jgi:hypothetical protein